MHHLNALPETECVLVTYKMLYNHGVGSRPYDTTDECRHASSKVTIVHLHIFTEDEEGRAGVSQPHDNNDKLISNEISDCSKTICLVKPCSA